MTRLLHGDCLDLLSTIPSASVDLILTDLPYGLTANKWDSVIPLDALWQHYWRIAKPSAAVVLTAMQPFTSALVLSQPKAFRYVWVWDKRRVTGFLNAKRQPLRQHEDILVFCRQAPAYNPQFGLGKPYKATRRGSSPNYDRAERTSSVNDGRRYPTSIIDIPSPVAKGRHPTQKPVALMEYLIRTYSSPGDTVIDSCMGSGTTGVACVNTGRDFIGIERDPDYFTMAQRRIADAELEASASPSDYPSLLCAESIPRDITG